VTRPDAARPPFLRPWLIWTAGFLAFPLAGLAGTAVAGRVDDPLAALVGGVLHRLLPYRAPTAPRTVPKPAEARV
jgi:hypothetical protein